MPDISPLVHAMMAVVLQCVLGLTLGMWCSGGVMGCLWFLAREHSQAEYRWIAQFGKGRRDNMPWWGGFDWRAWDMASLLDWLVPVLSCAAIFAVVR